MLLSPFALPAVIEESVRTCFSIRIHFDLQLLPPTTYHLVDNSIGPAEEARTRLNKADKRTEKKKGMTLRPGRRGSSGGDSTIEMMPPAFNMRDEDTHKEVYASPDDHYLGSPNNKPHPPLPENYPEMAAPAGLEPVQPEETKFGGVYYNKFQDDSPIPISAIPASFAAPSDAPDGNASKPPAKKPWHQNWTIRILIIALAIVIIVAIIVGAVVGTRASGNNDSSSGNDDNSTANNTGTDTETTATATETGTATTTSSSPSSTSTNPYEEPEPEDIEMGVSYNATFTMYGTGDGSGGSNCNTRQNACGLFTEVSLDALQLGLAVNSNSRTGFH